MGGSALAIGLGQARSLRFMGVSGHDMQRQLILGMKGSLAVGTLSILFFSHSAVFARLWLWMIHIFSPTG
jgi:hypothetical protein